MRKSDGIDFGKFAIFAKSLCVLFLYLAFSDSLAQSIAVNQNLAFGTVFPGVPKSVPHTTPGEAAEFFISGTAAAEVTVDFMLPPYLHTTGANMQLVFSNTDCALDSNATPNQTSPGYDSVNPWHTITYRIGSAGLMVWLGGTVVPGLVQKPGSYSATITMTVTYTGN
jgi:hypothetical protein